MLDRLFAREIKRRTGAHAISIYIDQSARVRKRSRVRGARTVGATRVTVRQAKGPLLHRINVRLPWLKFIAVPLLGVIIAVDLVGLTVSKISEPAEHIKIAPMSRHVKATERTLEGKKLVALTFDDGPMPETTPRLLDMLTEKDVPATFFMLGMMAERNPEIVQRAARERHEVASHSMYHQNLLTLGREAAQADLDQSKGVFKSILGERGPLYVRPPYGNYDDGVAAGAGRPLILWSVDTQDWLSKDPGAIVATAMSQVHDGAIILMHDIYPTSVEAVPALVDALRAEGYEFATIAELARERGATLAPGQAYYSFRP